jgi:hypothetical protein
LAFENEAWYEIPIRGNRVYGRDLMPIKNLFFGAIFSISASIVAGGLIGDWWALALLIPVGAILGWKVGDRI